jgi:hypothetical protein
MAFKIKIAGTEVVCDSPEEAIALTQKLAAAIQPAKPQQQAQPLQPVRKPAISSSTQPELPQIEAPKTSGFDVASVAETFLETIRESGQTGADGERLASALHLKHPKGLGGRLALIKKKIESDGYQPEELFHVVRDSSTDHMRRWQAGPRIDDYLRHLSVEKLV